MRKINIGLFTDAFFPMTDGVGMVVHNYAIRLNNYANVYVFCPKYRKHFDDSKLPYKVVRCKSIKVPIIDYSLPMPDIDRAFNKELDKYDLDIVHINSPFTLGKVGLRYAKRRHLPVVGTMHSQYKQDFKRAVKFDSMAQGLTKVIVNLYNKCDECWTVNREVARIYHEEYGCKHLPRVFSNATDMKPLDDPIEARKLINKECNISDDTFVFLFVGRLNNLKNIFFIVDVMSLIKKNAPKFDFKMIYVGVGQDEKELRARINKYHLEDNVLLYGKVDDRKMLASFYSRADLFVFPSMYDTSSLVQIEAASQSTPGIFAKDSATSATVTDNVNGFIEEVDDNLFMKRILKIVNDKKTLEKVGKKAYKDLYISWDERVKTVYHRYLEIIDDSE
jgi:glycosyltransferase involved in cell wall biosynthesis